MRVKALFLSLFLVAGAFLAGAQNRGLEIKLKELDPSVAVGRQWFVFIAIDKYKEWRSLQHPVKDARELKQIVSEKYYTDEIRELYNTDATKTGIIRLFTDLIGKVGGEDSVFIFYAGHGNLDMVSNTGFWIPQDAGADQDTQANWLPNSQIRGYITNLKARHVVVVADSCFSGDLLKITRGAPPKIDNEYLKKAYSRRSKQALTSGASETVPDESEFMLNLKDTLSQNSKPFLDLMSLFNDIKIGVRSTEPLMGDFKDTSYQDEGCFIFFLKNPGTIAGTGGVVVASPGSSSGALEVLMVKPGRLYIDGKLKAEIKDRGIQRIEGLEPKMCDVKVIYGDYSSEQKSVKVEMGETVLLDFQASAAQKQIPAAVRVKLYPDLAQAREAAAKERTVNSRKIEIVVFASEAGGGIDPAFTPYFSEDSLAGTLSTEAICATVTGKADLESLKRDFGIDHFPAIIAFNSQMSKIKEFYQVDSADTKTKLIRIVKTVWE